MALGLGVGSHDAEDPISPRSSRAPGLLPVDHPVVAIEQGPRVDSGQITAGLWLRPALGPDVDAGSHAGQKVILLLLRAEVEDGGGKEADAVGTYSAGNPRQPVFLLVYEPLHQVAIASAVGDRPRGDRPSAVEKCLFPLPVLLESGRGVHGVEFAARPVGVQPLAALGPELLVARGKGEIDHRNSPLRIPPGSNTSRISRRSSGSGTRLIGGLSGITNSNGVASTTSSSSTPGWIERRRIE